ncbi:MAG: tRNA glutamyl-Q synthetase [Verrucomicrobia bacterium]|nr:MAG: tRNA glutamyl-Q synthetase [Verrucomicrobiota bacterium]
MTDQQPTYRGRLAPSPTGHLHLGHARTFWIAAERTKEKNGTLILRNEDLDAERFRMDFVTDMLEDLRWVGLDWSEGPDIGGPFGPYSQSQRKTLYRFALQKLHALGVIYPCTRSRRDVIDAAGAPHETDEEPVYPAHFRLPASQDVPALEDVISINWRMRVPDNETLSFIDNNLGLKQGIAGKDFGDFLVWRKDDCPSYQLACVVDDSAMQITEVVRGADLVTSTFRQLVLYKALGLISPEFYHCALMLDEKGVRLAKRHDALSLRQMRSHGMTPADVIAAMKR